MYLIAYPYLIAYLHLIACLHCIAYLRTYDILMPKYSANINMYTYIHCDVYMYVCIMCIHNYILRLMYTHLYT